MRPRRCATTSSGGGRARRAPKPAVEAKPTLRSVAHLQAGRCAEGDPGAQAGRGRGARHPAATAAGRSRATVGRPAAARLTPLAAAGPRQWQPLPPRPVTRSAKRPAPRRIVPLPRPQGADCAPAPPPGDCEQAAHWSGDCYGLQSRARSAQHRSSRSPS